jgi:hypothetical protein
VRGHVDSIARGINVANAQPNGKGWPTSTRSLSGCAWRSGFQCGSDLHSGDHSRREHQALGHFIDVAANAGKISGGPMPFCVIFDRTPRSMV